jgi:ketosteroid isomerase-like protein
MNEELRAVLEALHAAATRLHGGESGPMKALYSHSAQATLLGALGGCLQGWKQIGPRYDRTAALFRYGRVTHEHLAAEVSGDLAYVVSVERHEGQLAGQDAPVAYAYRVTHVFRREAGSWRVLHRHADPLVDVQEPDSLVRPFLEPSD